jgi:folate-binding protein YgfZ
VNSISWMSHSEGGTSPGQGGTNGTINNEMDLETYNEIRSGRAGFYEQLRGLIAVSGQEAVPFLDGMITNDMKTLEDGQQMFAAFPNAQGRLIALVRVLGQGERYLFETEEATRETLYQNLFRFSFAGDFFVEDLSGEFQYFEVFGPVGDVYHPEVADMFPGAFAFQAKHGASYFMPIDQAARVRDLLINENGCVVIDDELYETLRIESGIPKYGVDMDETTIVPELGLDQMISYNKGCYVGQEIIARIHFRGHVAKQLTGLIFDSELLQQAETRRLGSVSVELTSVDGKNAGRITSTTFSPKLESEIALGFVRYDYLAEATSLKAGENDVRVTVLPFVSS